MRAHSIVDKAISDFPFLLCNLRASFEIEDLLPYDQLQKAKVRKIGQKNPNIRQPAF